MTLRRHKKLYGIWLAMRQRIYRKTHQTYSRYGGRGITICDEWQDFLEFERWAWSNGY